LVTLKIIEKQSTVSSSD
jgi:hypothetical protein